LQARAIREPDGGNPGVIEGGGKFVQPGEATAMGGEQRVDIEIEDAGSLAQSRLLRCLGYFS